MRELQCSFLAYTRNEVRASFLWYHYHKTSDVGGEKVSQTFFLTPGSIAPELAYISTSCEPNGQSKLLRYFKYSIGL